MGLVQVGDGIHEMDERLLVAYMQAMSRRTPSQRAATQAANDSGKKN